MAKVKKAPQNIDKATEEFEKIRESMLALQSEGNEATSAPAPSEDTAEEATQQGDENPSETKESNDIVEETTDVIDFAIEEETAEVEEATPSAPEHDWKKRYDDLRRESQKQQELIKQLQTQQQEGSLPSSPEELAEYKEKYPKHYNILQRMMLETVGELKDAQARELQELKQNQEAIQQEAAKKQVLERVLSAHPDALEIRKSDSFKTWIKSQGQGTKALFSGTAQDIITGLGLYKDQAGISAKAKAKQKAKVDASLDAPIKADSAKPTGTGKKDYDFTESQIANMSIKERNARAEEIYEASVKGRVLLDISK